MVGEIITDGAHIVLWGPGDTLEADKYGRLLAVVVLRYDSDGQTTLQEKLIRARWASVWEKYGKADAAWPNAAVSRSAADEQYPAP